MRSSLAGLWMLLFACSAAFGEEPLTVAVPEPAWDAVFDRREGWIGGDAIYSTPLSGGDVLWLFADTFIGKVVDGRRQPGLRMVNNNLARHALPAAASAPDPAAVKFLWGAPGDAKDPQAWIRPDPKLQPGPRAGGGDWYWVADATTLPDSKGRERLVVFLWRTARTTGGALGFKGLGNALAIVEDSAADWSTWQPRQFVIPDAIPVDDAQGATDPGEILWGSELFVDKHAAGGALLYIFGCRAIPKAANELVLARVDADQVENMSRWRFRTGVGWSERSRDAAALAKFVTTEFSITSLAAGGDEIWALIHSEPLFGTRIMARTARTMFGPWSKERAVYQVPDVDAEKKHFTYAAKVHPELSRSGELLVSYVVNSFDFGEAATNAAIYRPRFVRVPVSALPSPPDAR